MIALLFVPPELLAVLLHGAVYDPTYRPFPGGRYDTDDDSQWDEDEADEDDDDHDLHSGDNEDQLKAGSRIAVDPIVPNVPLMRLDLMAGHWRRHSSAMAVVVAGPSNTRLYGCVRIESGPRAGNTGLRHVTVTDRAMFTTPLALTDVLAPMSARHARTVRYVVQDGVSRPLPPGAGGAFFESLAARVEGVDAAAAVLTRSAPLRLRRRGRELYRFDTATTALRLFERTWRTLEPVAAPKDPPEDVTELVRLYERDAITDDSGVLPGWERSRRTVAGWWEFRSGDRRLRVKNVDATHFEKRSGADLVYMRRNPDAFVLVQYKMLSYLNSGEWEYVEDKRLASQIARMQDLCRSGTTKTPDHHNYRLGPGATFVKFVEPPRSPRGVDELLPGYYVPSEYLGLLLPQPPPRGKPRRLPAPPPRYLDPEVFVRLVRDVWVGTLDDATARLRDFFLSTRGSSSTSDLTFAYEDAVTR